MSLFDAHCHVEVGAAPERQAASAVRGRLLCGVDPADWNAVRAASAAWPGSVAAFGLHPWRAAAAPSDWPELLASFLEADPGAWLGEAGLDGLRPGAPPPSAQDAVLRRQLRLAARLDRPVNLHCVKAWEALIAALDAEYLKSGPRDFIVHSFGGPHQYIEPLARRGAFFTIGPLSARRESRKQRDRARLLPEDRLLLESDAFLAPGRDADGDLRAVLAWLADARRVDAAVLAERIDATSRRLFPDEHQSDAS